MAKAVTDENLKKPWLSDERMFKLIDLLKDNGTIRFRQEFFDAIEFPKECTSNVRKGIQHFRIEHITKACKKYKVNANWILGLEKNVWRE